jgi:hypothetical protein
MNEPFSTLQSIVSLEAMGIFLLALILFSLFSDYRNIDPYLVYVNACYVMVLLSVCVYALWYEFRISKMKDRGLRRRYQHLLFTMSAPSLISVTALVLLTVMALSTIHPIYSIVSRLSLPIIMTVFPLMMSTIIFGAAFQTEAVRTAIEALTKFHRVVPRPEYREYTARLWRRIWSFLLRAVEYDFRTQTLVGKADFSGPLNVVALALGFGKDEEAKLAANWLETLGSLMDKKSSPNELLAHLLAVNSMFPRLCEMHLKYGLSYDIRPWTIRRLSRTSDRILSLLLGVAAILEIVSIVYLAKPAWFWP